MNVEIYCDESRPDLLTSTDKEAVYTSIGGIWVPADQRDQVKSDIKNIRGKHQIFGEIKWNKLSPKALPFYCDLVDYFFTNDNIQFRTILIDSHHFNAEKYHLGDPELGFYKFYYQLVKHWLLDFNKYRIFVDIKTYKIPSRLEDLRKILNNSNILAEVQFIQSLPSREVVLIQFADLFTGAVNAKFNNVTKSDAKKKFIQRIEQHLGKGISATFRDEPKFNVFNINIDNRF